MARTVSSPKRVAKKAPKQLPYLVITPRVVELWVATDKPSIAAHMVTVEGATRQYNSETRRYRKTKIPVEIIKHTITCNGVLDMSIRRTMMRWDYNILRTLSPTVTGAVAGRLNTHVEPLTQPQFQQFRELFTRIAQLRRV